MLHAEFLDTKDLKSIIFWDVTPCSLLICNRRFGGTYRLNLQDRRKFQQEPPSKQVDSQQTTRRHIPEDDTLHNHRCENLNSYTKHLLLYRVLQI
jgi:hypothetical protein